MEEKNILEELERRKRLLKLINSPSNQEVNTPVNIAEEILDCLPQHLWKDPSLTWGDRCAKSGIFPLEIIIRLMKNLPIEDETLRYNHIINNMIRVHVNSKRNRWTVSKVVYGSIEEVDRVGILDINNLEEDMPKCDVVIGNPPFLSGLHLRFLEMAYNSSKKYVLWISPSAWILDEKGKDKKSLFTRGLIRKDLKSMILFNGNNIFNVGLFLPFSIITIIKDDAPQKIKVHNKIFNNEEEYDTIEEINKWNDLKIYPILKDKILTLCNMDNLLNHKNQEDGKYYINFPLIRGHILRDGKTQKMIQDDFYSFFPSDIKPEKEFKRRKWGKTRDFYFTFKTLKEAHNFLSFLKTRWAMFALSIFKINSNLNRGEVGSVPWLDWSEPWTETRFEKLIKATPEEMEFVYKNIPKYYS